jgi:TolA-binding protein
LATELFNKQKYGAAQESFNKVIETISDECDETRINAEYYSALCSLELFNSDAEQSLLQFISNHEESPKVKYAYFQLGKNSYRKKRYIDVVKWFEKIEPSDLNEKEQTEYYFESGYSFFNLDSMSRAKKAFSEVTDTTSKFYVPAKYYFSHISFNEKNYEIALQGFLKIKRDTNFAPIIPYYIAQIYFLQGNFKKVIEYAPPMLFDSNRVKRTSEISRILGEAYYQDAQYPEAIIYLERYKEKTKNDVTRNDNYELGFAYYNCRKYNNALGYFENVVKQDDSLAQNAYYLIADCYLKTNQKKFAMNTFQIASKLPFDKQIQEDALFKYAKLCYELSLNPYNEAINAFKKYINDYPDSPNINDANEYLINIFISTRNYKDALETIESMKEINDKYKTAYQRAGYYWGVELFNDKKIDDALKLFDKSLVYGIDKNIKAKTLYWKGEALYRKTQYDSAITSYNKFLFVPGAINLDIYYLANYNIGYCYFSKKDYKESAIWFRRFIKDGEKSNPKEYVDALLRTGDCYFVEKDYINAVDFYDKAANTKSADADYALYQKALSYGLTGKNINKVNTIKILIEQYEKSAYIDGARFELGKAYEMLSDNENALLCFKKITGDYPNSIYCKQALLKIGLIQYTSDKNKEALETFKSVVEKYPATEESKEALVSIQNIYVDLGDAESFFVYVKQLPFANVTNSAQDTISYQAVEKRYMEIGNCDEAITGFANYLEKFPDGNFALNANYYKAECERKSGNLTSALSGYNNVINKGKNKFTENALLKAAEINLKINNYNNALDNYTKLEQYAENKSNILEARNGQMKCYFLLKQYNDAIKSAKNLINTEKVTKELQDEAHIIIAKSALAMDSLTYASGEFQSIAKTNSSEKGAEAKYNIAYIYYLQGLYQESEKLVYELINQVPSYDYWITKGFILLADDYVKMGNLFQAKHTLKSIVDNSDNAELIQTAQEKLNLVLLQEKEIEKKKAEEEEIKVKLNSEKKNDKLFEEPQPDNKPENKENVNDPTKNE